MLYIFLLVSVAQSAANVLLQGDCGYLTRPWQLLLGLAAQTSVLSLASHRWAAWFVVEEVHMVKSVRVFVERLYIHPPSGLDSAA